MASVFSSTANKVAGAFRAATSGLDQYGPDIPVHPFAQNEIVDRGSGIARVVSQMIASRRGIANAREARLRADARKERDDLMIQHMRQVVAKGATPTTATDKTKMPISADLATQYGVTSFVPDPTDPTKGTADIHEVTAGGVRTRSREVAARILKRGAQVDQRTRDLAEKRLGAQSKVSEMRLLLAGLDTEASQEGERRARQALKTRDYELGILKNTRAFKDSGKLMTDEEFAARHAEAAGRLGLVPKIDKDTGAPVRNDKTKLFDYNIDQKALGAFVERAKQRGISDWQLAHTTRRAGIKAMLEKYIGLDKVLGSMMQGGHTDEGDQWNPDSPNFNPDAPQVDDPNAPADEPFVDPMLQFQKWDEEDQQGQ